jgi:threonine dehydratase
MTDNLSAPLDAPTPNGIRRAYDAIDPVFLDTPLLNHLAADAALGCRLFAKVETLNPTRAFKGRGTEWFMANMATGEQRLVAASAGNFGQGLARAATKRGRKVTMFAATDANPLKIAAMTRLGAQMILEGRDFDAAKLAAQAYAKQHGHFYIEDGAHRSIAEGNGTMALEITRDLTRRAEAIDTVLVPLGNGALLTGIGTWIKHALPTCRVIGIVAEAAPSMSLSWHAKRSIPTADAPSIADGIAVREPIPYALACMTGTVDDVWTVSEANILAAMRFAQAHYGVVLEPSSAAAI